MKRTAFYECHGHRWTANIAEGESASSTCPKCSEKIDPQRVSVVVSVMVASRNASGCPDFFGPVSIKLDELDYLQGDHYDEAVDQAEQAGYEGPMLPFDENEFAALFQAAQDARQIVKHRL